MFFTISNSSCFGLVSYFASIPHSTKKFCVSIGVSSCTQPAGHSNSFHRPYSWLAVYLLCNNTCLQIEPKTSHFRYRSVPAFPFFSKFLLLLQHLLLLFFSAAAFRSASSSFWNRTAFQAVAIIASAVALGNQLPQYRGQGGPVVEPLNRRVLQCAPDKCRIVFRLHLKNEESTHS